MTLPALHTAAAAMFTTVRNLAGVSVTYARDADSVALTNVTTAGDSYTEAGGENVEVGIAEKDFYVKATELILNSSVVEPEEGDTITETQDGNAYTYTVTPPGGLGEVAVWADPGRTTYRVHTQLDSVGAV